MNLVAILLLTATLAGVLWLGLYVLYVFKVVSDWLNDWRVRRRRRRVNRWIAISRDGCRQTTSEPLGIWWGKR